jgi:hypothetical protein
MSILKLKLAALTVGALVILESAALADFINLEVKWSQPIATNSQGFIIGSDWVSDHSVPWIMADDFLCNDPAPVKAIRWWGSYRGETPVRPNSTGYAIGFDLNIYLSTGAHPNSKPATGLPIFIGSLLAQEVFVGVDTTGDNVYRYDAYLTTPFPQIMGTEYFISIDKPTGESWGWHDSGGSHPILDNAAFTPVSDSGPWYTFNPRTDLAFEIMIPEPSTAGLALIGGGLLLGAALRRRK